MQRAFPSIGNLFVPAEGEENPGGGGGAEYTRVIVEHAFIIMASSILSGLGFSSFVI